MRLKGGKVGLFEKVGIKAEGAAIDWELRPADTFGMFESWGGKERIRNRTERFYYFFIDAWEEPPILCLMERGIKFAKVLARIEAPRELIDQCVTEQGKTVSIDKHYAINDALRSWLEVHVVEGRNERLIIPLAHEVGREGTTAGMPAHNAAPAPPRTVALRRTVESFSDDRIEGIVRSHNFFDSRYNPGGSFENLLVDNRDTLTVTDLVTSITWQRGGHDICTLRHMHQYIQRMNDIGLAGHNDWRLPTLEEVLSLLEASLNEHGLYLPLCFSPAQPFIFTADRREPGGHWFIDFKQGTVFWASSSNPGGFGRLCRG
jgi:hypothetical protein